MGNYQFGVSNHPVRGSVVTVRDTEYSKHHEFPKSVWHQGSKVKVMGTKDLLCSRPGAPKITCSLVQFPSGQQEVFLTDNLQK